MVDKLRETTSSELIDTMIKFAGRIGWVIQSLATAGWLKA